jgi:capsular polysaccharide transport system permease protein
VTSDESPARRGPGRQPGPRERAPTPDIGPKPASTWSNVAQHAQLLMDMRRTRRRRFFLRLGLFVGLPTLVAAIYLFLIATPRYQSEFQATYQTYSAPQTLASGIMQSFASTSQNNTVDLGQILYQYIRSPALLEKLDHDLHLRAYYSNPKIDFFSRLDKHASFEAFLFYYQNHVSVSQGLGGYLTVDVQAFDPKFAKALAQAIVTDADAMTDQITARARSDEIKVAEDEVAREEARVERSRLALAQFQNQHGVEDPERTATQIGDIGGKLESELAAARAQLAESQRDLSPSSPIVVQLKSQISALQQQLHQEQSRLAGKGNGTPYSTLLQKYSALQVEQEFAKSAYMSAQQGLAVVRADVARKEAYLVDFAPPNAPDRPSIYFPLICTFSVFLISLVIYGFGSLVVGAFRDQAGI